MTTTSPVQASDEPMRAAFWKFIATLPTPVQDNISTSEARGESVTAKAFESGYRAALKAQPAPTEAQGELQDAAAAVVARWESPKWKDEPHTVVFIERLRKALDAGAQSALKTAETRMDSGAPAGGGIAAQGEDSARLDALASEIEAMAPAHDRGCFGKRSDFDHYAEGHEYARKAAAARIREFAAVPQPQEQS